MTNRYQPLLRPAGYGSLPVGVDWEYIEVPGDFAGRRPDLPTSRHRYGIIQTARALTRDECERFDLRPV